MKEDYKITIGVKGYIVADVKGAQSMDDAIERTQKILDIFDKRYKGLKINDETQLYIHVKRSVATIPITGSPLLMMTRNVIRIGTTSWET